MNVFDIIWTLICTATYCIVVLYILHLNRMIASYKKHIQSYQVTVDRLEDKRKYNRPIKSKHGKVRDQWGRYMTLGQPLKPFKVGIKGKHGKFISQSKLTLLRNKYYD